MVEGDEQAFQLISIALSSGESAHAFQQDINLGDAPIFKGDTTELRSDILSRLSAIFVDFEQRKLFRLMRETVEFTIEAEGELKVTFKYVNLESDKVEEFAKSYSTRPE
jgi:hypothetical protein